MENVVILGDAVEEMKNIPSNSVSLVCADLPFGVTNNEWDVVIDPKLLFPEYWRVLKEDGILVLFGQDKFTAMMMLADPNHRYNLIWQKNKPVNFLNANRMPLRDHEDIMVFYKKRGCYNPQKTNGHPRKVSTAKHKRNCVKTSNYNNHGLHSYDSTERHPKSVWYFPKDKSNLHPTQKPVALIKKLILSYSNKGDLVLDNTAGSGTTGEACILTGRKYILIEGSPKDYNTILKRIDKCKSQVLLFQ